VVTRFARTKTSCAKSFKNAGDILAHLKANQKTTLEKSNSEFHQSAPPPSYSIPRTNQSTVHREKIGQANARTHGQRISLSGRSSESPALILHKMRGRWSAKNKNLHPRDVTMLEDKCHCRTRNRTANIAPLLGATLATWKEAEPNQTAPYFIRFSQRNIDVKIAPAREINA